LIKSQVLYQLSYGLAAADVEACAGPVNSKPSGMPVMLNALALPGPLARQPAGGEAPPRRSMGHAGESPQGPPTRTPLFMPARFRALTPAGSRVLLVLREVRRAEERGVLRSLFKSWATH
jgi:hypothetical protein